MSNAPESYVELLSLVESLDLGPEGEINEFRPARKLLEALIRYDTESSPRSDICKSNVELVKALEYCLKSLGFETEYSDEDKYPLGQDGKQQATLVARMAPPGQEKKLEAPEYHPLEGGVLLSAHTDVIPVPRAEYPDWKPSRDPYLLGKKGGRLIGRGTSDMKQMICNMLVTAKFYKDRRHLLEKPIYMALSWGEEIGCQGTPRVVELLARMKAAPELVIVGEPTKGDLIVGHKGAANIQVDINMDAPEVPRSSYKKYLKIRINTIGGHSSTPDNYINANKYSQEFLDKILALQEEYKENAIIGIVAANTGSSPNSIPSEASLEIHIGAQDEMVIQEIDNKIKEIKKELEGKLKEETLEKFPNSDLKPEETGISIPEQEETRQGKEEQAVKDVSQQTRYILELYRRLSSLQQSYKEEYKQPPLKYNGFIPAEPIINLGTVNTGAEKATLGIHIRPTSKKISDTIVNEIKAIAQSVQEEFGKPVTTTQLSETVALPDQSVEPYQGAIIETLGSGFDEMGKPRPVKRLVSYATEAGGITAGLNELMAPGGKKVMTVIYGLGDIDRAHRLGEYITVDELKKGAQFALMAIRKFCLSQEKLPDKPDSTVVIETGRQIEHAPEKGQER